MYGTPAVGDPLWPKAACRHLPKVGAGWGSSSRPDLYGGCQATGIPTVIDRLPLLKLLRSDTPCCGDFFRLDGLGVLLSCAPDCLGAEERLSEAERCEGCSHMRAAATPPCTGTPPWSILHSSDTTADRAVAIVAVEAAQRVYSLGSTASSRLCQSEMCETARGRRVRSQSRTDGVARSKPIERRTLQHYTVSPRLLWCSMATGSHGRGPGCARRQHAVDDAVQLHEVT